MEEKVSFSKEDRMVYGVLGYEGNELMAEISGYELRIGFNLRLINSLADAENCANALADVFYEALMEQLIASKPDLMQQVGLNDPILNRDSESGKVSETCLGLPGAHPVLSKDK